MRYRFRMEKMKKLINELINSLDETEELKYFFLENKLTNRFDLKRIIEENNFPDFIFVDREIDTKVFNLYVSAKIIDKTEELKIDISYLINSNTNSYIIVNNCFYSIINLGKKLLPLTYNNILKIKKEIKEREQKHKVDVMIL